MAKTTKSATTKSATNEKNEKSEKSVETTNESATTTRVSTIAKKLASLTSDTTLLAFAKKLESAKLSNVEYSTLRDAINLESAKARIANERSRASELSALNKLVRRNERATRAK